tara:strand:- start:53 stop:853 length:801 start_codon:yes stop_codon:yes gene_type:complete
MLRRQYKKRRNKKGGRNFFDAVSQGAEQWKSAATIAKNKGMEAAANTQQGIADFEASRKANVQRAMVAGEYSDLAKSLMKKKIEANPLGFAKQKQLAANLRDPFEQKMVENRNPNLSPMKLRRTRGGKRKSRRRKKSRKRKRKTRRKRRGGAIPAPMAYKKRVDRQEEKKQWTLNREMQTAKMKGLSEKQEEIKKKLKASFDRQAYWKTPGDAKNKDAIADFHVRKAMPGIEAAIKGKTLVPRKTRQTRSSSAGRKKRKTRRKRRR